MVGHRGLAEVERHGEFAGRVVVLAEQVEDAAACRVVERAKKIVHENISTFRQLSKQRKGKVKCLKIPERTRLLRVILPASIALF